MRLPFGFRLFRYTISSVSSRFLFTFFFTTYDKTARSFVDFRLANDDDDKKRKRGLYLICMKIAFIRIQCDDKCYEVPSCTPRIFRKREGFKRASESLSLYVSTKCLNHPRPRAKITDMRRSRKTLECGQLALLAQAALSIVYRDICELLGHDVKFLECFKMFVSRF